MTDCSSVDRLLILVKDDPPHPLTIRQLGSLLLLLVFGLASTRWRRTVGNHRFSLSSPGQDRPLRLGRETEALTCGPGNRGADLKDGKFSPNEGRAEAASANQAHGRAFAAAIGLPTTGDHGPRSFPRNNRRRKPKNSGSRPEKLD